MNTPGAFAEMRAHQRKESAEQEEISTRIAAGYRNEESSLYKLIVNALADYDGAILDGHTVNVTHHHTKLTSEVYVDKVKWLIMKPKRHFGHCHCEYACNCEVSTWVTLSVDQVRRAGLYGCYFPCGENELADKDTFAHSMGEMMDEFQYRDL